MRKNVLIFGHGYGTQFLDINNQYIRLFDQTQFNVTVVYLVGPPDENIVKKHLADEIIFLNCSKKTARGLKLKQIKIMLALCRQKQFDIVICHRYKPIYIMLCVAQFCKLPALFFVMHAIGTVRHLARKLIIALLARKNMFFAGVSNAVRDDIRKGLIGFPRERVITLYNMIDIELTAPKIIARENARSFFSLPQNAFIFGQIGRLAPEKDQATLLRAFALAKPHMENAKLVIIGDGPLKTRLEHLVQHLNLSQDVVFTGFVAEAFRYIKAFDTCILSSTREAFGRVLLEAMVAETPLIATRVYGIPEVVGDAGVLVDAANPEQLAEAMLQAYCTPPHILFELGKKCYDRAVNFFSITPFKKEFWALPLVKPFATAQSTQNQHDTLPG